MISKVYKRIFGFALYVKCYKHHFPHSPHHHWRIERDYAPPPPKIG